MTDKTPNPKPADSRKEDSAPAEDVESHRGYRGGAPAEESSEDVAAHGFKIPDPDEDGPSEDVAAHMPRLRRDPEQAVESSEDVEAQSFRHGDPADEAGEDVEAHMPLKHGKPADEPSEDVEAHGKLHSKPGERPTFEPTERPQHS